MGCTIQQTLQRLPDRADSRAIWDRLVSQYAVTGAAVHDTQLVATTLAHGVPTLLTLNDGDSARFGGEIAVLHPTGVESVAQNEA